MNRVLKQVESAVGPEERLRLALNSAGLGTWEWDLASGQLSWDERMHRLFGLAPGTFSGNYHDFVALLHPADRGVLADQLARIGEGGEPEAREVEFRISLSDGSVRYLADRSEAILDAEGHVCRMVGVTWDISGRMSLRVDRDGNALIFRLADYAAQVDCNSLRSRSLDELRPGGLGVHVIGSIMDQWQFVPPAGGEGNVLEMVKNVTNGNRGDSR